MMSVKKILFLLCKSITSPAKIKILIDIQRNVSECNETRSMFIWMHMFAFKCVKRKLKWILKSFYQII